MICNKTSSTKYRLYMHVPVHKNKQISMFNNSRVLDFHAEDCRSEPKEGHFLCGKKCSLPCLSKGVAKGMNSTG